MTEPVDRRAVRDALLAELGASGWRRFVDDANGRRKDMTRLLHWQREAWERVRTRLGIAPLAHDEVLALLRFCPVHDAPLECEQVPVVVRRIPTPAEAAQAEARFPYANTTSPGMGLVSDDAQREVWYCAQCRAAHASWAAARPPEPPPDPPRGQPCAHCGGADTVFDTTWTNPIRLVCRACGDERWALVSPVIDRAALPRDAHYAVIHRPEGPMPPLAAYLKLKRFGETWSAPSYFRQDVFEAAFRSGASSWRLGTTWEAAIDGIARRAAELGLRLEFVLDD